MGIETAIEWADHTANFWEGCTQISPACDHCYAKERAERYGTVEWNGPPRRVMAGAKVVRAAQRIAEETGVKQFVFVNSLSDFFDNQADGEWRKEAFAAIRAAPDCIFLLLTKRIGIAQKLALEAYCSQMADGWPPNAWLGVTVVNQEEADRDIPRLLKAKHELRIPRVFLSIEPMLGPIDLHEIDLDGHRCIWPLLGTRGCEDDDGVAVSDLPAIDWVICGGESGKGARPMHPDWARSLRDQCATAGVPFMFKQWGEWAPGNAGHGGDLYDRDRTKIESGMFTYNDDWVSGGPNPFRQTMDRIGKHAAGRLLDGVEHNGRPQP